MRIDKIMTWIGIHYQQALFVLAWLLAIGYVLALTIGPIWYTLQKVC